MKGHNLRLAEACQAGILKEQDVEVSLKKALDTNIDDVLRADGIVLVTPEYFGNMSGLMKDFFDRTYYPAKGKGVSVPYCLMICCENDGSGTVRNIENFTGSYTMRKALDNLIIHDVNLEAELPKAKEMGQTFAAGVSMGIF